MELLEKIGISVLNRKADHNALPGDNSFQKFWYLGIVEKEFLYGKKWLHVEMKVLCELNISR